MAWTSTYRPRLAGVLLRRAATAPRHVFADSSSAAGRHRSSVLIAGVAPDQPGQWRRVHRNEPQAKKLPKGYAVLTDIYSAKDGTDMLGARRRGRLAFDTSLMFTDPSYDLYSEASERSRVTLYDSARRVVKSQWRTDWEGRGSGFNAKIKAKGWYTLQVDAQRYRPGIEHPTDMLSPRVQAVFRMKLDPKAKPRSADVILPRMVPTGLDINNRARPGSRTVLEIRPDRRHQQVDLKLGKVTAKTATTQVSFDGGRTWRSLAVRKSGTEWLATITNPAPGAVARGTRITTTKNEYAQVTIVRAYTIG